MAQLRPVQRDPREIFECVDIQKKNGEPDIDAWETTLKEAEDDTLAYGQLSPEAKKVRRFLETFYKDNIEGKDPLIKFRENFYPRIINMEALLDFGLDLLERWSSMTLKV